MNQLYYGDNLQVLRDHIATESVDLIYLDPPFNSKRDYNLLFKTPKGSRTAKQKQRSDKSTVREGDLEMGDEEISLRTEEEPGRYSEAQIEAFEDTWHWNEQAEREFDELMQMSLDAGTLKKPIQFNQYVDESFFKAVRPVTITL